MNHPDALRLGRSACPVNVVVLDQDFPLLPIISAITGKLISAISAFHDGFTAGFDIPSRVLSNLWIFDQLVKLGGRVEPQATSDTDVILTALLVALDLEIR